MVLVRFLLGFLSNAKRRRSRGYLTEFVDDSEGDCGVFYGLFLRCENPFVEMFRITANGLFIKIGSVGKLETWEGKDLQKQKNKEWLI